MTPLTNRLLIAITTLGLVILVTWLMVIGRSLLVPFVIAVVFWYLLLSLAGGVQQIPTGRLRFSMPKGLALLLAFMLVLALLAGFVAVVSETFRQLGSPGLQGRYNAQFLAIIDGIEQALVYAPLISDAAGNLVPNSAEPTWLQRLGLGERFAFGSVRDFEAGNFIGQLVTLAIENIQSDGISGISSSASNALRWASQIFGPVSGLIATTSVILLYTAFLLVETSTFEQKMHALARDSETYARWRTITDTITKRVGTYLRIKTFTSALTGILGYAILKAFSVDFAEFWGLLLFLFNYIPIIGSFIATILPIFVALVQPGIGLGSTALVSLLLISVQQGVGSFIEPRLMGNTLNLSPLVILISLAFFGSIWGVTGALLSVPLVSIIGILLASFESSRWLAVILSRNGRID
jgi:predicted PurR-regulated permease PerM